MRSFILCLVCALCFHVGVAQEISFRVLVFDKLNRQPIAAATVKVQDLVSLREYKTTTNDSGIATLQLKPTAHYRLEVNAKEDGSSSGYLSFSYMLSEKEAALKKIFSVEMEKVKHTDSGLLPAMHFEYNNPTLSTENQTTLDNVLKMVGSFPSLQIEIGVYADCHENDMLVAKRATAIKDYLTAKGETKHVVVKEEGNIRALNQCNCANPNIICSEEKYLENRRAEFKVIAF